MQPRRSEIKPFDGKMQVDAYILVWCTLTVQKAWNKMKEGILAVMDANREESRRTDLQRRHFGRCKTVRSIYDVYKARRTPLECRLLPFSMTLCSLPELKERIEADAEDPFPDIEDRLPDLIVACEEMVRREAQITLAKARRVESYETIDLNLATSVLRCGTCTYTKLLFGSVEQRQHECHGLYLQSKLRYDYPPLLSKSVEEVIRLACLNPATATIEDMDREMVYFHCRPHPLHLTRDRSTNFYSWRSYVRLFYLNPW